MALKELYDEKVEELQTSEEEVQELSQYKLKVCNPRTRAIHITITHHIICTHKRNSCIMIVLQCFLCTVPDWKVIHSCFLWIEFAAFYFPYRVAMVFFCMLRYS